MPTLTPATRRRTGDDATNPRATIHWSASTTATAAPVIAAVLVPPSACRTSQSTRTVYSPKLRSSSMARTLRPINRWISCVRPPSCCRSRAVRVRVARGSIEYSAVSHPAPLPRRQPGTPSSTEAVQRTRVSPNATRHDPSAYGATPRSRVTGRISSARRPVRLELPAFSTQPLDCRRRGMAGAERYDDHLAAPFRHLARADDRRLRVVSALDQDVGPQVPNELQRGVLLEDDDRIHGFERGEDVAAVRLAANRALRSEEH